MAENHSALMKNRTESFNAESTRNGIYVTPRVDIVETEGELLLYADMPGVRPEDIDLRYENGELILRGKVQRSEVEGNLIYSEFEAGDFYRVFQVHETINTSKIDAEFKSGVLIVHLPKQEAVKPKQVAVRATSLSRQGKDKEQLKRKKTPVLDRGLFVIGPRRHERALAFSSGCKSTIGKPCVHPRLGNSGHERHSLAGRHGAIRLCGG